VFLVLRLGHHDCKAYRRRFEIPDGAAAMVVERTFAWLDRYRRLSKDYEVLNASSETRCHLAAIRTLLKRLTTAAADETVTPLLTAA
jgi:hypothetical protein